MHDDSRTTPHADDIPLARQRLAVADAVSYERERCIAIVTALWGADLVTTQACMRGEITLDEAVRR
jgi:hypothetical protein